MGASVLPTLELMELHINTLFCLNADGRLRCVNEHGEPPAPLFYMGRTREANVWRFRHDLPAALVVELNQMCHSEPLAFELAHPPKRYAAIRAAIQDYLPGVAQREHRGPAYWIPEAKQKAATNVVLISDSNSEFLRASFPWMIPFIRDRDAGPVAAAVEQGTAVSLCFCSRRPALATEAGIETLANFRGRGYATATVAAWAAEVRRRGLIPLYSTSWDNFASQAVARKLEMVMVGEDWSIE